MASINLIEAFQEFKDAENIDRPTMMKVVEDVFKTLLRKKYGADDNFDVIVNAEKGDLEIMRRRMIVNDGEVNDPLAEIAYKDAAKIEPDFEVGEELDRALNWQQHHVVNREAGQCVERFLTPLHALRSDAGPGIRLLLHLATGMLRSARGGNREALEEFIARRRQKGLLELMGSLEWDETFDYKAERTRD